jgi:hypothetical protein
MHQYSFISIANGNIEFVFHPPPRKTSLQSFRFSFLSVASYLKGVKNRKTKNPFKPGASVSISRIP